MRLGQVLAGVVGVAIVAVGAAFGWSWLRGLTSDEVDPQDHAATTVAAYIESWESNDYNAMLGLVRSAPDDFAERHLQMMTGLTADRIELATGTPTGDIDGLRDFPVSVRVFPTDHQTPIVWSTQLRVIRERGRWAVDWNLATIHPELRESWQFAIEVEPTTRAPILAVDGQQIAGDGISVTLGFEPASATNPEGLAAAFEAALPGTGRIAERELNRTNLVNGWFYPVVTVSRARADEVWDRLRPLPGALRREVAARSVHGPQFAQHTVGVVAPATAEQLAQLGDAAEPGMLIAQYGLERELDDRLEGSDIVRAGLRESDGAPMRVILAEHQDDPSEPIITTLDLRVQHAVEAAISGVDRPAAIVVIEAGTGAIAGAASRPLSGYHRAFEGRYPPGSTFKVITAEALLAAGRNPHDSVECPAETVVGGLSVRNAAGMSLDTTDLATAFAASCNTTFAQLATTVGTSAMIEAATRFGFGVEPSLPLDAFGGSFPEPRDTAELAAAAFGQARVEASVVHMASVAAAVEAGAWHQPYLLADRRSMTSTALAPRATGPLREMLRLVVTDGTGTAAAVDDAIVGGKTGTAQSTGGVEHAWFIGTFDGLGFAVLVEDGGAGGAVAAPIARRLVEQLLAHGWTR